MYCAERGTFALSKAVAEWSRRSFCSQVRNVLCECHCHKLYEPSDIHCLWLLVALACSTLSVEFADSCHRIAILLTVGDKCTLQAVQHKELVFIRCPLQRLAVAIPDVIHESIKSLRYIKYSEQMGAALFGPNLTTHFYNPESQPSPNRSVFLDSMKYERTI